MIKNTLAAVKMITPTGVITTNRVPSSGAGPNENRFIIGSEGILGIITEVWLRVQEIIKYKYDNRSMHSSFSLLTPIVKIKCRR